jgi:hypothetical protein
VKLHQLFIGSIFIIILFLRDNFVVGDEIHQELLIEAAKNALESLGYQDVDKKYRKQDENIFSRKCKCSYYTIYIAKNLE